RRGEANDLLVRVLREHAALDEALAVLACRPRGGGNLDAHQQAAAANLGDAWRVDLAQLSEQVLAVRGRALGQLFVDEHAQSRDADGGCERIAAERAAVVAGLEQLHDLAAREHGRERIDAAAERLAEYQ